jgi:ABC-type cobalamin/Fe3+-siderophores transport system ATPase subunit
MRLQSFRVRRFRNIIDSGEITVDPEVTCLVGMNEAGKTAVLSALHRLNAVDEAVFDTQQDYPRWLLTKDRRDDTIHTVRPVEASFELDEETADSIAETFGEGVLSSTTAVAFRRYDDDQVGWDLDADEAQAVANIITGLSMPKKLASAFSGPVDFSALTTLANEKQAEATAADEGAASDIAGAATSVLAEVQRVLGGKTFAERLADLLDDRLPQFFYFGEYSVLAGRIDLTRLAQREAEETASSSDQTARALLSLANTTSGALAGGEYESRKAELEAVSNDLTRQVFDYWKQNPNLRVRFDLDRVIEPDRNGNQQIVTNVLDVRVEDTRHYFTNNFDFRSSGFRWFFSFLAAFTEFETRSDKFVILLDEPGLTLHGRAQGDFVRFVNERLAPTGPVLYTTHSPFMVETDRLDRVRIVEDGGPEIGAVVSQESLTVGAGSLFPLQAALGYDIAQNLFIGQTNLLVEGPSDLLYLDLIGRHLGENDREALDERWRVLPAGGASNIPAFVSLIGQDLEVTVVVDAGTEGTGRLDAAMSAGRLSKKRLVQVSEITDRKHSDIEDLFTVDDYLSLYNAAFAANATAKDLPGGDRIVSRLEKKYGKFDHYKPAERLLRNPDLLGGLCADTLAAFERLIKRINSTI